MFDVHDFLCMCIDDVTSDVTQKPNDLRAYSQAKSLCFGSQLESTRNLTMTNRLFARRNMTCTVFCQRKVV